MMELTPAVARAIKQYRQAEKNPRPGSDVKLNEMVRSLTKEEFQVYVRNTVKPKEK